MTENEDDARLVLAAASQLDVINRYREVTDELKGLNDRVKLLEQESKALKAQILTALALDPDPDAEDKLVLLGPEGQRLLRVSAYPSTRVDPKQLREFYPEVYQQVLTVSQQQRVTVL